MAKAFDLKKQLKLLDKSLLRRLFDGHGVLTEVPWDSLGPRDDPIIEGWSSIDDPTRRKLEVILQDVNELADERSQRVLVEDIDWRCPEKRAAFARWAGLHDKALWAYLEARDTFDEAAIFARAEALRGGQFSNRWNGLPKRSITVTEPLKKALEESVRAYYHEKELRGDHCRVHHYRRASGADYFYAYLPEWADKRLGFDATGDLTTRELDYAFHNVFIYESSDGALEIIAKGGKQVQLPLRRAFCQSVLGIAVEDTDPIRRSYELTHLLDPSFAFTTEPEDQVASVRLTADYVLNDHLPGKALAVLHRVCEEADYDRTQRGAARDRVTEDDVVRAVSAASGVPEETLRGVAERSDYEQSLGEVIFGQPHVVREVAGELGLIKAGMTDPTKPASVMLFLGQTGTGKTETAKALARFYSASKRLKSYALGNCVEPHSVATIIGVPPGYVGHDQGGRLVTELNADPYGVFLLDEADKAHPDVLQPFLNLFDEGWLSDQRGVRAYAGKSIFVLTSNVGQRMIADWFAQGLDAEEVAAKVKEALPQIRHGKLERPVFAPEFLARVKRIIVFRPLGHEAMVGIAGKHTRELQRAWAAQRGKRLEVPESLVEAVAARAHELNEKSKGKEGGRIVRRLVADWVESPLQRELTRHPDAYRLAEVVALEFASPLPDTDKGEPDVRVVFPNVVSGGGSSSG